MPTLEELKAQMTQQGVVDPTERNRQIATAVQGRKLTATPEPQTELTDVEVAQKWEPAAPELTGEEAAQRLTPLPEEEEPTFAGIVQKMAQNYQTSPQYQKLLDQELAQISEQIAELMQRRNMIEMATKGQG